jgi:hypothetical protein
MTELRQVGRLEIEIHEGIHQSHQNLTEVEECDGVSEVHKHATDVQDEVDVGKVLDLLKILMGGRLTGCQHQS